MTTYVMTRLAISRHERRKGTPSICRYYGERIQEGDLCVKRLHGRRDRRTDYVQAKCYREGFRYGRKNEITKKGKKWRDFSTCSEANSPRPLLLSYKTILLSTQRKSRVEIVLLTLSVLPFSAHPKANQAFQSNTSNSQEHTHENGY